MSGRIAIVAQDQVPAAPGIRDRRLHRSGRARASAFGALLLGVHDETGQLHYAGRVGTGFDASDAARAARRSSTRSRPRRCPFAPSRAERSRTRVHWVKPELVAEVAFAEWTRDGILRHAVVPGSARRQAGAADRQVEPKPARTSRRSRRRSREEGSCRNRRHRRNRRHAKTVAKKTAGKASTAVAGATSRHPERVLDKRAAHASSISSTYYEAVADWMLPHLAGPSRLARARARRASRRAASSRSTRARVHIAAHRRGSIPSVDPGIRRSSTIDDVAGLSRAAQMACSRSTRGTRARSDIEKPDRMVFDLDPGEGVALAARDRGGAAARRLLEELGLDAFVKTTGGKGLHVVVPIEPHAGWDDGEGLLARGRAASWPDTCRERFSARAARRTATARSSSTTCATTAAPPRSPRSRCARGRAWAHR